MRPPISLAEHTTSEVELRREEAGALAQLRVGRQPVVNVGVTASDGVYRVGASSIVGVIDIDGRTVSIAPKVGSGHVLFMLTTAVSRAVWLDADATFASAVDFNEFLFPQLVREAEKVLMRGLLEDYVDRVETEPFLKGRLRVADQVRRHMGTAYPLEITYQDFSADILENQLLRAALERAVDMRSMAAEARSLVGALAGVEFRSFDPDAVPEPRWTARNTYYARCVAVATLILRHWSIETGVGPVRARGVLFDMNRVFEDFVFAMLRDALGRLGHALVANAAGKAFYLDGARRLLLEPDVSVWRGPKCVVVGDIKYKDLDEAGVRGPDVYQALTYAVAAGADTAWLIYAGTEPADAIEIPSAGRTIKVVTVDLHDAPSGIVQQVEGIAASIAATIP